MGAPCLLCKWPEKNDGRADKDTLCLVCLQIIQNASSDEFKSAKQMIQEKIQFFKETVKAAPAARDYLERYQRLQRALDRFGKEDKRDETKNFKRHPLRKPDLRMVRSPNFRQWKKPDTGRMDPGRPAVC